MSEYLAEIPGVGRYPQYSGTRTTTGMTEARVAKLSIDTIHFEDFDLKNPRIVLMLIGILSNKAANGKHPAVPEIGLAHGSFGSDDNLLHMDDVGNVILTRVADNEEHLGKGWQDVSSLDELLNTSIHHGGGGGLPTSGLSNWEESFKKTASYKMVGIFKIPAKDLLIMIENEEATLGNIGEGEIVLNPASARRYLSSTQEIGNRGEEIIITF